MKIMMIWRTLRTLSVVAIVGLMAGCKIAVIAVEGGGVTFGSSAYGPDPACSAGSICILQVNDTSYTETFYAIPKNGWRFVKWGAGDYFLCQNSTSINCEVSLAQFAGNATVEEIVASARTYYLMPIFEPLTEIGTAVTMNGKAWAPMNSFSDLSWDAIDAVCPAADGGHCLEGGKLMEYDMTGWTWASVDDVNALINSFNEPSDEAIGPGPDELPDSLVGRYWTEAFPASASTYTVVAYDCAGCYWYIWNGWTSTPASVPGQAYVPEVYYRNSKYIEYFGHATTALTDDSSAGHSAWFYRTP